MHEHEDKILTIVQFPQKLKRMAKAVKSFKDTDFNGKKKKTSYFIKNINKQINKSKFDEKNFNICIFK